LLRAALSRHLLQRTSISHLEVLQAARVGLVVKINASQLRRVYFPIPNLFIMDLLRLLRSLRLSLLGFELDGVGTFLVYSVSEDGDEHYGVSLHFPDYFVEIGGAGVLEDASELAEDVVGVCDNILDLIGG
jgi:hypothetical protein